MQKFQPELVQGRNKALEERFPFPKTGLGWGFVAIYVVKDKKNPQNIIAMSKNIFLEREAICIFSNIILVNILVM